MTYDYSGIVDPETVTGPDGVSRVLSQGTADTNHPRGCVQAKLVPTIAADAWHPTLPAAPVRREALRQERRAARRRGR